MSIFNQYTSDESVGYSNEFLKNASSVIYHNKVLFDEYKNSNHKLAFVKHLKELMGCGLKESKDIADLYWVDKLPNPIKEERRDKLKRLEELAKHPLIDDLIPKIKNLNDSQLRVFLTELSIDVLLSIDEKIENNE